MFTLHVVALPHTRTDGTFGSCAFTNKVIGFCQMMKATGNTVYIYGSSGNTAPCDEFISCVSEEERLALVGTEHYTSANWGHPFWQMYNARVFKAIRERLGEKEFLCLIGGDAQEGIHKALVGQTGLITLEFGVGYAGGFAPHQVFESYAWMHACYGRNAGRNRENLGAYTGKWYDAVIPGYLDTSAYLPATDDPEDYCVFLGRNIPLKGTAVLTAIEEQGIEIRKYGPGWGQELSREEIPRVLHKARALIAPTLYLEPFGNVHIEAMAAGVPVITTDWGVFSETVTPTVGERCRELGDFVGAILSADRYDRKWIQYKARKFDLLYIQKLYQDYLERLYHLHERGWYTL